MVAEEDNRVVGYPGWTLKQNPDGEKYGYITKVIVHPEFQKEGIATELLQKAEVNLKDKGASHVHC